MTDVSRDPHPYTDGGTGAYPPPPESVTVESPVDVEPTGAVEGPPAEVTVTSPAGEEVTNPTGAADGPGDVQTTYEWPGKAPDAPDAPEMKEVKANQVEDKAVTAPESTT